MEGKAKIYQKWWFWVILLIILICLVILIFINNNNENNNYRKQAITILNQYKSGNITNKEASKKLETLSKRISNEPDKKDSYKSSARLALETKLSLLSLKLFDGELSDTEINSYIKEMK